MDPVPEAEKAAIKQQAFAGVRGDDEKFIPMFPLVQLGRKREPRLQIDARGLIPDGEKALLADARANSAAGLAPRGSRPGEKVRMNNQHKVGLLLERHFKKGDPADARVDIVSPVNPDRAEVDGSCR